jgi:hypothetical protein
MIYIFVAYIYDLNTIIVCPMALRTDTSFIAAFTKVFAILRAWDYQSALNIMDNECSKAVEKHIRTNTMTIQLVPPHNIVSTPPNKPSELSKNTLLPPLQPPTTFALYNFGMSFYHKLNSLLT